MPEVPDRKVLVWKVLSLVVGAAAGAASERLIEAVWTQVAPGDPPTNAADRRNGIPATLVWAAAVGIGAGVARAMTNRSAAALWEVATDEAPPGVDV